MPTLAQKQNSTATSSLCPLSEGRETMVGLMVVRGETDYGVPKTAGPTTWSRPPSFLFSEFGIEILLIVFCDMWRQCWRGPEHAASGRLRNGIEPLARARSMAGGTWQRAGNRSRGPRDYSRTRRISDVSTSPHAAANTSRLTAPSLCTFHAYFTIFTRFTKFDYTDYFLNIIFKSRIITILFQPYEVG